jgi:hypothetical protein
MKNIKNTLFIVASIGLFSIIGICQAEPNFELYNKDKAMGRIKVTVNVGGKNIVTDKIVDFDEAYQATIDPQQPVRLTITLTTPGQRHYMLNAPGKTKYLSWDTSKSATLYPQTGPLKGLMGRYNPFGQGKTESGLPLNNNISESQITIVK